MATDRPRTYPSELPVLALRHTVVFPLTLQPVKPLNTELKVCMSDASA